MPWGSEALAAREATDLAADKPLTAPQVIPVSPTTVKWVEAAQVGAGDIGTWTDRTDSDFPTLAAYDGRPDIITKPKTIAAAEWYLAFDMGALIEFDCAFLIGTNFGTLGLNVVELAIADDNAFSANLTTIGSFTATDDRMADLGLEHGGDDQRYTAQYIWLKLEDTTPDNFFPEVGDLILGRRRQWKYKPTRPYGDRDKENQTATAKTEGGVQHKSVYSRNAHIVKAAFVLDEAEYIDDMEAFHNASRGHFVWVYDPNTSPAAWHLMMLAEDSLIMPQVGPTVYEVDLGALEQGPESFFLANQ